MKIYFLLSPRLLSFPARPPWHQILPPSALVWAYPSHFLTPREGSWEDGKEERVSPPRSLQTLPRCWQGGLPSPKQAGKSPRAAGHRGLRLFSTSPQPQTVKSPESAVSPQDTPSLWLQRPHLGAACLSQDSSSLGMQLPWEQKGSPHRRKRGRGPESAEGHEI